MSSLGKTFIGRPIFFIAVFYVGLFCFRKDACRMNVLWVCNICPSPLARALGLLVSSAGGWISSFLEYLLAAESMQYTICFQSDTFMEGSVAGMRYLGFQKGQQNQPRFEALLRETDPDLIHIWGTERKHALEMTDAAQACNMPDRVVVNIQGLVSIIGKYHYFAYMPPEVCVSCTPCELRNHRANMFYDRNYYLETGEREISVLKKAKYVVGRSEWDMACTAQIQPGVRYYHINETLRSSFYESSWDYDQCEKYSLFISQSYAPFKGLHLALQAMPLILQQYPQAHLYVPGDAPKAAVTLMEKYHQRTYPKYLCELLDKDGLREHVTFLGTLSEKEMCQRYLKSNAFACVSSIENSPNSLGEAMLLGMPVVSSDVGGVKDFISHHTEGYLYPADAPYMLAHYVSTIFSMGKEAENIGKLAQRKAQGIFDREKNMKDMLNLYHEIADSRK